MKYICYDCERNFNYPKFVKECTGMYGSVPYIETMAYCPFCGSECIGNPEEDARVAKMIEERKNR